MGVISEIFSKPIWKDGVHADLLLEKETKEPQLVNHQVKPSPFIRKKSFTSTYLTKAAPPARPPQVQPSQDTPKQGDSQKQDVRGKPCPPGYSAERDGCIPAKNEDNNKEAVSTEQPEVKPNERREGRTSPGVGGSGGQSELGRHSSGSPGGDRSAREETTPTGDSRIISSREEFLPEVDLGIVPPDIAKHLKPHQLEGVARTISGMDAHDAMLLGSGTGVGKTRQELGVAKYYADKGYKVLFVTKGEIIDPDFKKGTINEESSFFRDSKAMGIPLTLSNGAADLQGGGIHLSTYKYLANFIDKVDDKTVIIFDESHATKNLHLPKNRAAQAHNANVLNDKAAKVMYASATLMDKPVQLAYLFRAHVFGGRTQEAAYKKLGLKKVSKGSGGSGWDIDPKVGAAECYRRLSGLFDQLTKEGLMFKQEITMKGLDVGIQNIKLNERAHEEINRVEKILGGGFTKGDLKKLQEDFNAANYDLRQRVEWLRSTQKRDPGTNYDDIPTIQKEIADLQHTKEQMEEALNEAQKATKSGKKYVNTAQIKMAQRRVQEYYKIPATVSSVQQELAAGRSVVVFASRVNDTTIEDTEGQEASIQVEGTMKELRKQLEAAGLKAEDIAELHGELTGDTTKKDNVKAFQSGKAKVILATVESGGTGIDLDDTVGNAPRTLIMMTAPFSGDTNVQAAGRVWRLNTKSNSRIQYIVADTTVDNWNMNIVSKKMKSLGASVSGEIAKLDVSPEQQAKLAALEADIGMDVGEKIEGERYEWEPLTTPHKVKPSPFAKKNLSYKVKFLPSYCVNPSFLIELPDEPQPDNYSCILPGQELRGKITGGSKAWYSGDAVKIYTPSGSILSVTVNHPVLTEVGFIPAGSLKEGDYLLNYVWEDKSVVFGNNKQHAPAVVEEVFSTLLRFGGTNPSSKLTPSNFDFHGDAEFFKGDIQVVGSYRPLGFNRIITNLNQFLDEDEFIRSSHALSFVSGLCRSKSSFYRSFATSHKFMGAGSLVNPPFFCKSIPLQFCGFRDAPNSNSVFLQESYKGIWINPKFFSKNFSGFAFNVPSSILSNVRNLDSPRCSSQCHYFGMGSESDTIFFKKSSNSQSSNASLFSDLFNGHPTKIHRDKVCKIERFHYDGPVYDFESPLGYILVNGILISNCGASCAYMVGKHYGAGPKDLEGWKEELGTTLKDSTSPLAIVAYMKGLGLQVEAKQNLTLDDLDEYLKRKWPIIVCVQDYGDRRNKGAEFLYGHYLIVIGRAFGYIFCQDPSADNVLEGKDSLAAPGKVMIEEEDFVKSWHDRDKDGNKYIHFGIAIGPPIFQKDEKGIDTPPVALPPQFEQNNVMGLEQVSNKPRTSNTQLEGWTPYDYTSRHKTVPAHDLPNSPYMVPANPDLNAPKPHLLGLDAKAKTLPSYDVKSLGNHKYGCVLLPLPLDLRKEITDWTLENIPDCHLAPKGRQARPHITLLYGIEENSLNTADKIRAILTSVGPIEVEFLGFSFFKGGKDGDVLKIDVSSPVLDFLHEEIKDLIPCKTTHPNFLAHVTIAYLDPAYSFVYE